MQCCYSLNAFNINDPCVCNLPIGGIFVQTDAPPKIYIRLASSTPCSINDFAFLCYVINNNDCRFQTASETPYNSSNTCGVLPLTTDNVQKALDALACSINTLQNQIVTINTTLNNFGTLISNLQTNTHPALTVTNTPGVYSWNSVTQTLNIPPETLFSANAGLGISISAGGTNGHSPTISVRNSNLSDNNLRFNGNDLYVPDLCTLINEDISSVLPYGTMTTGYLLGVNNSSQCGKYFPNLGAKYIGGSGSVTLSPTFAETQFTGAIVPVDKTFTLTRTRTVQIFTYMDFICTPNASQNISNWIDLYSRIWVDGILFPTNSYIRFNDYQTSDSLMFMTIGTFTAGTHTIDNGYNTLGQSGTPQVIQTYRFGNVVTWIV